MRIKASRMHEKCNIMQQLVETNLNREMKANANNAKQARVIVMYESQQDCRGQSARSCQKILACPKNTEAFSWVIHALGWNLVPTIYLKLYFRHRVRHKHIRNQQQQSNPYIFLGNGERCLENKRIFPTAAPKRPWTRRRMKAYYGILGLSSVLEIRGVLHHCVPAVPGAMCVQGILRDTGVLGIQCVPRAFKAYWHKFPGSFLEPPSTLPGPSGFPGPPRKP